MKFLMNLFKQTKQPQNFTEIVFWWGERRLAFNIMIGLTGLLSILICWVSGFHMNMIYVGIIAFTYCIALNILYTGGWVAEWFIRKANNFDERISYIGPVFFGMGIVVCLLLTLFGGILAGYLGLLDFISVD